ncbi:hypothetical protein CPAV1605_1499 [seawater metagenome]|uniref:EamA domain-containing protein n=1 Tax=seawater metagenome TaxID=1561972 RepID=A0A5E8CK07_9ZZZZ
MLFLFALLIQIITATIEPMLYQLMIVNTKSVYWYFYQSTVTIFFVYLYNYLSFKKNKKRNNWEQGRIPLLVATFLTIVLTLSIMQLTSLYEVTRFYPIMCTSVIFLIFIWGYFLFGEKFDKNKLYGGILLLIGTYIFNKSPIL